MDGYPNIFFLGSRKLNVTGRVMALPQGKSCCFLCDYKVLLQKNNTNVIPKIFFKGT